MRGTKPSLDNTFITAYFWRNIPGDLRDRIVASKSKRVGPGVTARQIYDLLRAGGRESKSTAAEFKTFITTREV